MNKFLSIIITILGLCVISSCKKREEKLIIGIWELKTVASVTYVDEIRTNQYIRTYQSNESALEFREHYGYSAYSYGVESLKSNYTIKNNQIILDNKFVYDFEISETHLVMYNPTGWSNFQGHSERYEDECHYERK